MPTTWQLVTIHLAHMLSDAWSHGCFISFTAGSWNVLNLEMCVILRCLKSQTHHFHLNCTYTWPQGQPWYGYHLTPNIFDPRSNMCCPTTWLTFPILLDVDTCLTPRSTLIWLPLKRHICLTPRSNMCCAAIWLSFPTLLDLDICLTPRSTLL